MSVATIEGIVENGQIRLPPSVHLPEHARVLVVVPDMAGTLPTIRLRSPKLADRKQAVHLTKHVIEERS